MAERRTWGALLVALVVMGSAKAQTYPLSELAKPGDCYRYTLDMKLAGEIRVQKNGTNSPRKLESSATHEFPERVLNVGMNGLPEKTARLYEKAGVAIVTENEKSERTLRPERRLIVCQRSKDRLSVYSTSGPLTREELELTSEHFDTHNLTGLLPGKPVAVGDTWNVPTPIAQNLCNFEGLTEQTLVCKLAEVGDQSANVTVTGTASGIELGALVKLTIEAVYQFDLKAGRLTRLEWRQKDDRDQGPASPASSIQSTTVLTRTPIAQPPTLSDVALVSVPDGLEPPQFLAQLEFTDVKSRFHMLYHRDWQTVSQTEEHIVLRLLEQGEFLSQCTITPWTKAEKGSHLTADEFRQAMTKTQGWEPEQELQAGEVPAEGGRWIYRISALGQLDGSKVLQNFYLIAGADGDQVVLVFTMTPKQADRLGTRDLSIAANLEFSKAKKN